MIASTSTDAKAQMMPNSDSTTDALAWSGFVSSSIEIKGLTKRIASNPHFVMEALCPSAYTIMCR